MTKDTNTNINTKNKSPKSATQTSQQQPIENDSALDQKNSRRVRLTLGTILGVTGAFLTIAIVSYCINWDVDQNHILTQTSSFSFLFDDHAVVNNIAGRFGALMAHLLVFRGMGIVSLIFTTWLFCGGINILYGQRIINTAKWGRYMAIAFLFLCPLLSFIFLKSSFPIGGALGNGLISWSQGFAGTAGVILMLCAVFLLFATIVFNFDIKPHVARYKEKQFQRKEAEAARRLIIEQAAAEKAAREMEEKIQLEKELAAKALIDNFELPVYESKIDNKPFEPQAISAFHNTIENEDEIAVLNIEEEISNNDITLELIEINEEVQTVNSINLDSHSTNEESDTDDSDASTEDKIESKSVISSINLDIDDPFENFDIENPLAMDEYPEEDLEIEKTLMDQKEASIELEPNTNKISNPFLEDFDSNIQNNNEKDQTIEFDLDHAPSKNKKDRLDLTDEMEVIQAKAEPTIPKHGAHISIESGEPYDPSLDLPNYKYPTLDLLEDFPTTDISLDRNELEKNKQQIVSTLRSFGIEIQRISATVGPTVTLYEIVPAEGVRISKIRNLEDDIALSLAALGIRMIAPIPGKGTIGIEVPNAKKQIVSMKAMLASEKFVNNTMSLPIALGKKIDNENYIVDLATMPHLLVAGATGQGKSVGINAILVSLLYKKHPSQLKFVLVDPKKVELSIYRTIEKHFLAKLPNEEEAIITDTKKVINTLNALCIEMDNRYELLKDAGARNIKEYNEKFIKRKLNPKDGHKYLPFIVLVIDEFADLIMTAGKEVEMPIARLAQLARAIGIHLIVATQRPSVNVITGIIKANFPARIAFRVSSKIDSRTILDTGGADQLIGRGDMLISYGSELIRLQCAFVDTPEVDRIVSHIGNQRGYPSAFELPEYEGAENENMEDKQVDLSKRDKMFEECARMVVNSQSGSTSMLQRKFNLGYNRAGRIMDQLEAAGIVGATNGSKPRDVQVTTEYELDNILSSL